MTRSNRTLTQFVVDRIRYALVYGPESVGRSTAGNTEVEVDVCSSCTRPAHPVHQPSARGLFVLAVLACTAHQLWGAPRVAWGPNWLVPSNRWH